jgi:hypothetical protein
MKGITAVALATAFSILAGCSDRGTTPTGVSSVRQSGAAALASQAGAMTGFGFNGTASGFPHGIVFLTGGGSFDVTTASNVVPNEDTRVSAGGGFRCTDGVQQGPLAGCATDEGVRWDTAQLLASTSFKCTAADVAKPAATGADTVVVLADFYRAGNGNDESFKAQMIVASTDLAPNIPGEQNIWIQGVGCGTAVVHFSK